MSHKSPTQPPPPNGDTSVDDLLNSATALEQDASRLLARSRDLRVAASRLAAQGKATRAARQRLLELAERAGPAGPEVWLELVDRS